MAVCNCIAGICFNFSGVCVNQFNDVLYMMNKFYKFGRLASIAAVAAVAAGCAGGGYANNNMAGMGYPNQGYPGQSYPVQGAAGNDPLAAVEGVLINSVIQSMAGSVLNGQIGSQITPADQNFRLQQLGGMVQSGAVNQAQQWVNPQTGSAIALNPIGQNTVHPQTRQQCQSMEEVVTMPNGQSIRENRLACLDSQTGKWNLVQ